MNQQEKKPLLSLIMSVLAMICLGSCSPISFLSSSISTLDSTSQNRGLGGYITDGEMRTRYHFLLFEHDHKAFYHVKSNVYEGRILLMGSVPTPEMQEDAVRIAWQVPGVRAVSNELQICKETSIVETAKDKWISTKLNTSLFFNQKVKSRNYEVLVLDGTVYLVGIAASQKALDEAIETARTTSGVKKVVSYVRIVTNYEDLHRETFANSRDSHHDTRRKVRQDSRDPSKRMDHTHRVSRD